MLVDLKRLKPNPFRDLTVDPIEPEKVAALKASIKDDGFWGGVVARRRNGDIEIAAGHHRVEAAIAAGFRQADVYVAEDLDDAGMVRIYARENATQRGNTSTAVAGSIAAAIRVLAKIVLAGTSVEFNRRQMDTLRGQIASHDGIGRELIVSLLQDVIHENLVRQHLATLKESGDYGRIIGEVRDQIEAENREALKALERAEKERAEAEERAEKAEKVRKEATERARREREEADRKRAEVDRQRAEAEAKLAEKRRVEAEAELKQFDALRKTRDLANAAAESSGAREKTFEFEKVAKYFTNPHQLEVFRQQVTGLSLKEQVPVSQQAPLARSIVQRAKELGAELTGQFIREHIRSLVLVTQTTERRITREDREAILRDDRMEKARHLQSEFARGCSTMSANGLKLQELRRTWPTGEPFPITSEFREAVKTAKKIIDQLDRRF